MRRLFVFLAVLAALWSAAWYGLGIVVDGRLDDILAREANRGRKVTCAERAHGGFPFALRVTCARFGFETVAPLRPIAVAGGRATFGVSLVNPLTPGATFASPMEISLAGGERLVLNWRAASATIRFEGRRPGEARLDVAGLTVSAPGRPVDGASADTVGVVLLPASAAGGAFAFESMAASLRIGRLVAPIADRLSRNDVPAEVKLDLTTTGLAGVAGLPPPLALDRWRRAGGRLEIAAFSVAKGDIDFQAAGVLFLDDERRPAGRISGSGKGLQLGPAAPQSRAGAIASRVGAVAASVKIPFAITLENGVARAGPLKLIELPPLY